MSKRNENTNESSTPSVNDSRRQFIGYGAMGLILTPLVLTGCGGGDSQGDGRTPPKGGGKAKPKPPKTGGGDGGATTPAGGSTKYELVDAATLSTKNNVTVDVNYLGKHVEWTDPSLKAKGLPPDDGTRAMGDMEADKHYPTPNPLGTKYVVVERILTVKDGDKVRLCNAIVVLKPTKVDKVAKNADTAPPVVDNKFFRFEPRVMSAGKGSKFLWHNGDQVKHEVNGSTLASTISPLPGAPQPNPNSMTPGTELTVNINIQGWYGVACGLHTWELQRIMITDHAYNKVANAANRGKVSIADVADGEYELQVWHETTDNKPIFTKAITVNKDSVSFPVEIAEIF
ncbi:MAG: hypothetical protein IT462_06395 [Planctomycetes bacterium]|nr:hypothetical protein [Planctomycetota bacterium]